MPIDSPQSGDTVQNPFYTNGTVDPPTATVSAVVVSRTNGQQFPGTPASMMGPTWQFSFNVTPDKYTLTVSGGNQAESIDITVVGPPK